MSAEQPPPGREPLEEGLQAFDLEAKQPDQPDQLERPGSRPHRHSIITMGLSRFVRRVNRTLGFGLDIGGTLLKFVCFEPVDAYGLMEPGEADRVRIRIRRFLDAAIRYSRWEGADHLKYQCEPLGGIFHFLKMPTTSMQGFVDMIADFEEVLQRPNSFSPLPKGLPPGVAPKAAEEPASIPPGQRRLSIRSVSIVGVTGGGSRRFANSFERRHLANIRRDDESANSAASGAVSGAAEDVPTVSAATSSASASSGPATGAEAKPATRPRLKSGQSQSHGTTTLVKYDEMACLVQGVNFLLANVPGECYVWKNVRNPSQILSAERQKVLSGLHSPVCAAADAAESKLQPQQSQPQSQSQSHSQSQAREDQLSPEGTSEGSAAAGSDSADVEVPVKQSLHIHQAPEVPYPYLLVNVGSGVSVLRVDGEGQYTRVGGSSVGGGTFLGLCRLFTGAKSFEEAVTLAIAGRSTHVDMLVSDIYGGGYDDLNLPGDTIASSFGKFGRVVHENVQGGGACGVPLAGDFDAGDEASVFAGPPPVAAGATAAGVSQAHGGVPGASAPSRLHLEVPASSESGPKEARPADLAASALLMVTINICSLVVLHAQVQKVDSVIFAGNFLAGNTVSQQLLTWALDFWSNHTMTALFLEHEGYFGAIGALVMSISDRQGNTDTAGDQSSEEEPVPPAVSVGSANQDEEAQPDQ